MDEIYRYHQIMISNCNTAFKREVFDEIDWSDRLIAIKGARGVGKSTYLLQHIKQNFDIKDRRALYISLDNLSWHNTPLIDIAEYHLNTGGTHLFVDEIHKYPKWSFAIKNIYDLFPKLKIIITGSSLLAMKKSRADLSRRALVYTMPGLSLREFINLETKNNFVKYNLEDILNNHIEIANHICSETSVLNYLNDYWKYGYYPFFLEGKKSYQKRLEQAINTILDIDMKYEMEMNVNNIYKLRKFLVMLACNGPFEPNISKLAGSLELPRNTLNQYLYQMEEAGLLNVLLDHGKSYSNISKPEKILMENTNLMYLFSSEQISKGTLREVFFVNQISQKHTINSFKKGDFLVDGKYTFEIGGKSKSFNQIANINDSYVVSDQITTGLPNKIPLWLFGFLY